MLTLESYLRLMVDKGASDIFFSPGTPVHLKVEGVISPATSKPMAAEAIDQLVDSLLDEERQAAFRHRPEVNLGVAYQGLGRFRINIFRQRDQAAMVVRYLKDEIPGIGALKLPLVLQDLALRPRGLVLVVGATGSGKSTTLASMIDYRNQHTVSHILTIEDPIEYVHTYKRSIVNQREVGIDTLCYGDALKNALREAPDVILIGEIRDKDTMQHAIAYAETGHLCLASLHASNSSHTLQRVLSFFPEAMHRQVLLDLSQNLQAVVSQRLVINTDQKRVPAVEVLLVTPLIKDLIQKGAVDEIRDAMVRSSEDGMQSFDDSLYRLLQQGHITEAEAIRNAESMSNMKVKIRLNANTNKPA